MIFIYKIKCYYYTKINKELFYRYKDNKTDQLTISSKRTNKTTIINIKKETKYTHLDNFQNTEDNVILTYKNKELDATLVQLNGDNFIFNPIIIKYNNCYFCIMINP